METPTWASVALIPTVVDFFFFCHEGKMDRNWRWRMIGTPLLFPKRLPSVFGAGSQACLQNKRLCAVRPQCQCFLLYQWHLQSTGPGVQLIPLVQLSGPFGSSFEAAVLLLLSFLLSQADPLLPWPGSETLPLSSCLPGQARAHIRGTTVFRPCLSPRCTVHKTEATVHPTPPMPMLPGQAGC